MRTRQHDPHPQDDRSLRMREEEEMGHTEHARLGQTATPGSGVKLEGLADHLDLLRAFITESNRIEGIHRRPSKAELDAHLRLMNLPRMSVAGLEAFVAAVAPDHYLRRYEGMDVRVGEYIPPPGGYSIVVGLASLVTRATDDTDPYTVHCDYEQLHPFTDGNGRSGRALWLWMMLRQHGAYHALRLGFLHRFYYQTLAHLPASGYSQ